MARSRPSTARVPIDAVPAAPTVTVTATDPVKVRADALVIGLRPGDAGPVLADGAAAVDAAAGKTLAASFAALGATGAAGQVHVLPAPRNLAVDVVVATGLGATPAKVDPAAGSEAVRRALGNAVRGLAGTAGTVAVSFGDDPAIVAAAYEGAALGGYVFDRYRTSDPKRPPVGAVSIVVGKRSTPVTAAADRARVLTDVVNIARDLVNLPPSDLTPAVLADRAAALGKKSGCSVEILDDEQLRAGSYGGIIGVGQGSVNPPRLVLVSHRPRRAHAHVAMIGKGITFDSGGLSIKPTPGMLTMKCDMAGAAAVLGAVLAAAALELPVRVDAWLALAENMPGGNAQRPSDVLRMRNGTTCEVFNTDAEGRLVMADALARSSEDSPDLILDVATLTGACVVALGQRTFGVMGNDDELRERVVGAAGEVGEPAWPLPLLEESPEKLESKVADIAHWAPGPQGGALTAASFLASYVGAGIPWAHLDIAGPAFNDGAPRGYTPSGGTGAAVRTLVRLLETTTTRD